MGEFGNHSSKEMYMEFLQYIHTWVDEEGIKLYHELGGHD
jgi:hypothetical protein